MSIRIKKILLTAEFILLFFGVPLFMYLGTDIIHPSAIILPVLAAIFIYLKRLPGFRFRELIQFKIKRTELLKHGIIVIITSGVMLLTVYLFDRENLFNLPKANPRIFLFMCFFYPVFSVYGQEIVYRVFIFYRYREVFKSDLLLIFAAGVAFSFAHIIYFSSVSIILTFLLGLYLTATYIKTKSVLLTSVLHGVLGDIVFMSGLGGYFWLDMYKWM